MLRYVAAVLFATHSFGSATLMAEPVYQNASISSLNWTTDYKGALSQAKAENKNLFLFFTGSDWCTWCHKLEQEVLDTPEFANLVGSKYIFVMLDFPRKNPIAGGIQVQNQELQKQYNVKSFPTVVIVSPDEKVLKTAGYKAGGPQAFVGQLN